MALSRRPTKRLPSDMSRVVEPTLAQERPFGSGALPGLAASHRLAQLDAREPNAPLVQPKLLLGGASGQYEQEADRVAAGSSRTASPLRAASTAGLELAPPQAAALQQARGAGQALPEQVRAPLEAHLGRDFSQVRVHTSSAADQLNRSLHARALTSGHDIFFRQGEFAPGQAHGQQLLHHELTHVAQQEAGGGEVVQAKLMSAADVVKLTGKRGARILATTSYEKVIDVLKDYEKLLTVDKAGTKKTERATLLVRLIGAIDTWMQGGSRSFNFSEGTQRSEKEDTRLNVLLELKEQAEQEHAALVRIKAEQENQQQQQGQQPKGRQRRGAMIIAHTSQDVLAQRAEDAVKEKKVNSGVKKKVGSFFHYTFGLNFTVSNALAIDPKNTLLPAEIHELLRVMDKAAEDYKMLLAAGVEPVRALYLAYMGLPEEMRPNSPAPEARLALLVKRQFLQEALDTIGKREAKRPPLGGKKPTLGTKIKRAIVPVAKQVTPDTVLGAGQGVGTAVGTGAEQLSKNVHKIGAKIPVIGKIADPVKQYGAQTSQVSVIGTQSLGFFQSVYHVFGAFKALVSKKSKGLEVLQAWDTLVEEVQKIIMQGVTLANAATKLAGAVPSTGIPGIGIVTGVLKGIHNTIEGLRTLYHGIKERSLAKKAKAAVSELAGAIQMLARRNFTLTVRSAVEVISNALSAIGSAIQTAGVAEPAGTIVGTIGTIISVGNTVVSLVQDSYRAGVAQEAEMQAQSGQVGSDVKVFKQNTTWAVTGIILAAKEGNGIALEELKIYGVTAKMLEESTLEEIRSYIMKKVKDEKDATTLGQKAMIVMPKALKQKLGKW